MTPRGTGPLLEDGGNGGCTRPVFSSQRELTPCSNHHGAFQDPGRGGGGGMMSCEVGREELKIVQFTIL